MDDATKLLKVVSVLQQSGFRVKVTSVGINTLIFAKQYLSKSYLKKYKLGDTNLAASDIRDVFFMVQFRKLKQVLTECGMFVDTEFVKMKKGKYKYVLRLATQL